MVYKNNQIWVDYVRVFATFCVVFLHSAAPLLYKYNELPKMHWWIGNTYDSAVRICVPLFFMISGYLLLEKNENFKIFFQKRFNKVVVPLLAWSIIYVFGKAHYGSGASVSLYSLFSILLAPAYYHLWFLYTVIGIYLFMPILRVVVNNSDRKMLNYYVLLWFLASSLIPSLEKAIGLNSNIDLVTISGFSGYLVLGLLLGKYTASTKVAMASVAVFLVCTSLTSVGTYLLTIQNEGIFSGYFYGYLSPNVIIMSGVAFVFLKYLIETNNIFRNPRLLSILHSFSSASLGIYLVHAIFLDLLSKGDLGFTLSGFAGNPIYSIPATLDVFETVPFEEELPQRRFEVQIDEDLMQILSQQAKQQGIAVSQLINDMLREKLEYVV